MMNDLSHMYYNFLRLLFFFGINVLSFSCSVSPWAQLTTDKTTYSAPAKVRITNQSKHADATEWNMGDGTQSLLAPPQEYLYTKPGKYTITVTAKKGNKTHQTTHMIEVKEPMGVRIECSTSLGNFIIRLYDDTPLHKANFIKLVSEGYYDGTLFHRIIPGFMVQGGDPNSKNATPGQRLGTGGPGYTIPAEFLSHHYHKKGALAAARMGDQVNPRKESSGSQFYVVVGKPVSPGMLESMAPGGVEYTQDQKDVYTSLGGTPHLDMGYTVFGEVVEGLDVIDAIATQTRDSADRPQKDISMKMRIVENQ